MKKNIFIISYLLFCSISVLSANGQEQKARQKDIPVINIVQSVYKDSSDKVTDYYLRGIKELHLNGNRPQASALFRTALQIDSLHAPSNFEMAKLFGNTPEALQYSLRANRADTSNIWYKYQLGQIYIDREEYSSAIDLWKKIIDEDKQNLQAYRSLCALYNVVGQPINAMSVIDTALVRFGNDLDMLEYKQQLLMQAYNTEKAIENAKLLTTLYPDSGRLYLYLGELYAQTGKDSLAMEQYVKARETEPDNVTILVAICDFYESINRRDKFFLALNDLFAADGLSKKEKIDYFQHTFETSYFYNNHFFEIESLIRTLRLKYGNDYDIDQLYARHLIHTGKYDDALAIYKSHLPDSIQRIDTYKNIIGIESYKNNPDSVYKYSAMAIEAFPEDTDIPLIYVSTLVEAAQYPQAIKTLDRYAGILENDSLKSVYIAYKGDIEQMQGNLKKTYKAYDEALKYDPGNINVLNNYSYFLSEEGRNLEKAFVMASQVIAEEPSNATYLDTYAWILYKLGRYEEAKTHMRKAIALDTTGSGELFLHYGDILYALKEYANASIYWDKAEKAGIDAEQIKERKERPHN